MAGTSDSTSGSAGNWIFRNKDDGKTSATASLVCLLLRDRLTMRSVHVLEVKNVTRIRCFTMLGYDLLVGCGRRTCSTRQILRYQ